MPVLSNYSTIESSLKDWLLRTDSASVASYTEAFIDLGQTRILRDLRVHDMEKRQTLSITSGVASLPANFLEIIELTAKSSARAWPIQRASSSVVEQFQALGGTGPKYFHETGNISGSPQLEFGPEPSSGVTVDLLYYEKMTKISTSTSTNWLSTNEPDLILFAALMEASIFMKDTQQQAGYKAEYDARLEEAKANQARRELSGDPWNKVSLSKLEDN